MKTFGLFHVFTFLCVYFNFHAIPRNSTGMLSLEYNTLLNAETSCKLFACSYLMFVWLHCHISVGWVLLEFRSSLFLLWCWKWYKSSWHDIFTPPIRFIVSRQVVNHLFYPLIPGLSLCMYVVTSVSRSVRFGFMCCKAWVKHLLL